MAGVQALLKTLRASPLPVLISVVGSCRDVALAERLDPKLFAAKCAGVYLNAGSGTPDPVKAARLEYNVNLDPASYAAIFDLPCPVYWLPCFEVAPGEACPCRRRIRHLLSVPQKDVLPRLSPRLQNYFAFMLKQGNRTGSINPMRTPFARAGFGRWMVRGTRRSSNGKGAFFGTCGARPGSSIWPAFPLREAGLPESAPTCKPARPTRSTRSGSGAASTALPDGRLTPRRRTAFSSISGIVSGTPRP